MYAKLTTYGTISSDVGPRLAHSHAKPDVRHLPAGWSIAVLDTVQHIIDSADEWRDVETNCGDTHAVFQSYTWCLSWVQCYCTGQTGDPIPQIYLLKHHGVLKAVLPMMLAQNGFVSVLTILGEPHTQLANILVCRDDCSQKILKLFFEAIRDNSEADVIAMGSIPDGSPLKEALIDQHLREDPATHISAVVWEQGHLSSDYLNKISKNRRKDLLKKQRRLEEMGRFHFEVIGPQSPNFRPILCTAITWKRNWLQDKSMVSIGLTNANLESFLTNISGQENDADATFHPEVEVLSVGGKAIAISMSMVGKGFRHCYLSAYDPNFSDVSPGTLVHQFAIQHSIDNRLNGYSFLGFPTHFKSLWCNQEIGLNRYIMGTSFRGVLWVNIWSLCLRPFAKLLLDRVRITGVNNWINRLLSKS